MMMYSYCRASSRNSSSIGLPSAADGAMKGFVGRRPGEELVRPGPHRLQDQFGIGFDRDREDAGVRGPGAQPFDVGHRRGRVAASVDDDEIGRRAFTAGAIFDDG